MCESFRNPWVWTAECAENESKRRGVKKKSRSCKTLSHQLCLRDSQTGTRGLCSPLSTGVTCFSCLILLPHPQKWPLTPASLQEKCAEQRPVTHSGCYTWVLPSPTTGTPAPLEQLVWSYTIINSSLLWLFFSNEERVQF